MFFSLELYCDQTVLFFQVFSIVLKSFCPLQSKNTFVLVLALFFLFLKRKVNICQNLLVANTDLSFAWMSLTVSYSCTFNFTCENLTTRNFFTSFATSASFVDNLSACFTWSIVALSMAIMSATF